MGALTIELTESAAMIDEEASSRQLRELRAIGVNLAAVIARINDSAPRAVGPPGATAFAS